MHDPPVMWRQLPRSRVAGSPGLLIGHTRDYPSMKAIGVYPGQKSSVHLAELPLPSLEQLPNGRGMLVRLLRCGVDGTDKEINAGEYGAAPDGYDFLTI